MFEREFENMIKDVYNSKLAKNSAQYQDLRRAFYAGAAILITNSEYVTQVALQVLQFSKEESYKNDTKPN